MSHSATQIGAKILIESRPTFPGLFPRWTPAPSQIKSSGQFPVIVFRDPFNLPPCLHRRDGKTRSNSCEASALFQQILLAWHRTQLRKSIFHRISICPKLTWPFRGRHRVDRRAELKTHLVEKTKYANHYENIAPYHYSLRERIANIAPSI